MYMNMHVYIYVVFQVHARAKDNVPALTSHVDEAADYGAVLSISPRPNKIALSLFEDSYNLDKIEIIVVARCIRAGPETRHGLPMSASQCPSVRHVTLRALWGHR